MGVLIPPPGQWDFGVWVAPSCSALLGALGFVLCTCEQVVTFRAVLSLRVSSQVDRPILPVQLSKWRCGTLPVKPLREKI